MYEEMVILVSKVEALLEEQQQRRKKTIVSDINYAITLYNKSLESYSAESARKVLNILFDASNKQLDKELLFIRSLVEEYRQLFNNPDFKPEISLCLPSRLGLMAPLENESKLKSELAGPWTAIHPYDGGYFEHTKQGYEVYDGDSVALFFREDYSDNSSHSIIVSNKNGTVNHMYVNDEFEFPDKFLELPRVFEVRMSATPLPLVQEELVWVSMTSFVLELESGDKKMMDYRVIKSNNESDYELRIRLNKEALFEWNSGQDDPPVVYIAFSGKNVIIYKKSFNNSNVVGSSLFKYQHSAYEMDYSVLSVDSKFSQLYTILLNLVGSGNPKTETIGREISFQYMIRERSFSPALLAQNFLIKELKPFFKLKYIDILPN
jgi:hypothetical protein